MGNKLQHGHVDADDGGTLTAASIPPLAAYGRVVRSSGDLSTTSTTMIDLTGASITLTTTGRPVLLTFNCSTYNSAAGNTNNFTFLVDGTSELGVAGIGQNCSAVEAPLCVALVALTAALSAGSHTFKVQWRTTGGTATVRADSDRYYVFSAMEIR